MKIEFLEEPELQFGTGCHVDIRFGLMNYGPLDFESPVSPHRPNVGIVGNGETVQGLAEWLEKCRAGIAAKPSNQPNLFPRFPGFREDNALKTSLILDSQLQRIILNRYLDRLKALGGSPLGIHQAVDLFVNEIATKAHVILCGIPLSLIKQQGIASGVSEAEGEQGEQQLLDFHHLLKARAMQFGVPIQLVIPSTYDETKRLPQKFKTFKVRTSQDEATRAWNLHVALYYKSGGIPWRLPRPSTAFTSCHVGISFYESLDKSRLLTSVAQVFNERGEGTIVRGARAKISKDDRQPHLDKGGAQTTLTLALDAYGREHHHMPARVVVHKSSLYARDEAEGFRGVAEDKRVESLELLTLQEGTIRLFREGAYPTLRGTLVSLSDKYQALYTRGSVDFFHTYPGMYAPQALGIRIEQAEQAPKFLANEILELTKMNWNNTQFDGFEPITLRAARQVGKILKYVPEGDPIQSRYAFYM